MKLPIALMIISSLILSFFISLVICYLMAKFTSMPSRRKDFDNNTLDGAIYRAKVDNLKICPKVSDNMVSTKSYDK